MARLPGVPAGTNLNPDPSWEIVGLGEFLGA
jgi:hypothetical protein